MADIFDRFSSLLRNYNHGTAQSLLAKPFIAIGILWSSQLVLNIFRVIRTRLLKRSTIDRYTKPSKDGRDTWALVTGSSDGIGKAFAEEFCTRGVNVIIHGRNEEKLNRVRGELTKQWPNRQVRILLADSGSDSDISKLQEMCNEFKDLNLRILINNVGGFGTAPLFGSFADKSSAEVTQFININALFTTEITRILMPQLIQNEPSLVMNTGTALTDIPSPWLSVYAAAKAFLFEWSRSLRLEMVGDGHDIEVLYLQIGEVQTSTTPRPVSLFCPSSRHFAQCCLAYAGCGYEMIYPYWPHRIKFGTLTDMPTWFRDKMIVDLVKGEKDKFLAQYKKLD